MVLIDTWWNVNEYPTGSIYWGAAVLIDTWWNVNLSMDYIGVWSTRF